MRSRIQDNRKIDDDVEYVIEVEVEKCLMDIYDYKILLRLKAKVYKLELKHALLYEVKYWPTKMVHAQKVMVPEMRTLRWMYDHTLKDKIGKDIIQE